MDIKLGCVREKDHRAARMLDVRSGNVIANATIVVTGTRITAAGANVAVPAGAEGLDLGDPLLVPGLIDPEGADDAAARYALDAIADAVADLDRDARDDDEAVTEAVRQAVRRALRDTLGKRPVTEVHVVRLG